MHEPTVSDELPDELAGDDWLANFMHDRDVCRQQAETVFGQVCEQLAERGIDEVRIAYDGYGDSGCVENIAATASGQPVELDSALERTLGDSACELLPPGWENNEGAYGELVLDVPSRKLTREHHWRIEATEYEEEEIEL